ncbi:MAG: substrate-binding domain-containing protein [bacterium]
MRRRRVSGCVPIVAAAGVPVNRGDPSVVHEPAPRFRPLVSALVAAASIVTFVLVLQPPAARAASDPVRISGTGSGTGGMILLAQAYRRVHPGTPVEVMPAIGSTGGIRAVIDGRLAISVANRPPSAREAEQAPLASFLYARTPFVIALSRQLGITGLTTAQLAAIYDGSSVSFPNGKRARPLVRLVSSTDMDLLKALASSMALAVETARKRPGMLDAVTDTEAADILETTPGAIGPSTLAQIESEKRQLVALTLDGRAPTLANLANGEYPHHKELHLISQQNPPVHVQRFIDFVRSDQGRRILSAAGHAAP